MKNYDDRCAPPSDEDAVELTKIEVDFAIPVFMSQAQQRKLLDLLAEIVRAPENQIKDGVHWVASVGARPNFSVVDAALLGVEPGPNAPPDGEEPTYDDEVFHVGTSVR